MRHKKRLGLFVAALVAGSIVALSLCANSAQGAELQTPPTRGGTGTTRSSVPINATEVPYPEFQTALEWQRVSHVSIYQNPEVIIVVFADAESGERHYARTPRTDTVLDELIATLTKNGMWFEEISGTPNIRIPNGSSGGFPIFSIFLVLLLLVGAVVFMRMLTRKSSGPSSGGLGDFSKMPRASKPAQGAGHGEMQSDRVTFADVAGIDEVLEEVREVRDFLVNPGRFRELGAKPPKGVLLYGPPGCGKTLLARAVAGESGAAFFAVSGSDFVQWYVGTGASRVRELFSQARSNLPAIIFIDEIDAVAQKRGGGSLGDAGGEYGQTVNALLNEMDGFSSTMGLVVIGATNLKDVLDPAILRPGRFDRHIRVNLPDFEGRIAILRVHAKNKPINEKDLEFVAKWTSGMNGADLANVLNEAAIIAVRRDKKKIERSELDAAIERVLTGPLSKSRRMSERDKRIVAYHEAGHALVGYVMPGANSVQKVSIVPRGEAGGVTISIPEEDKMLYRESDLKAVIVVAFGGRAAEELIFTEASHGAVNDIQQATTIARRMIVQFGMSEKLGPIDYSGADQPVYAGKSYSDRTAAEIDREVRRLINEALQTARAILAKHREALERMVVALLEKESISTPEEIAEIFGDLPQWEGPSPSDGNPAPIGSPPPAPALTGADPAEVLDSGEGEGDKNLLEQAAGQVGDVLSKGIDIARRPLGWLAPESDAEQDVETKEKRKANQAD